MARTDLHYTEHLDGPKLASLKREGLRATVCSTLFKGKIREAGNFGEGFIFRRELALNLVAFSYSFRPL